MSTVQYCPLDQTKREIRLLKLYAIGTNTADKDDTTTLRCDLIHASLNDDPTYMALSYTWGSPQDTRQIIIGDTPVSVTRNLHSAMLHLRATTTKTIWIDAVCINQSDNQEKSWQVQLMSDIYARADHVAVWLGPVDATSDAVMEYFRSFGTKAIECGIDSHLHEIKAHWRTLASHSPSFRDRSKVRQAIQATEGAAKLEFELGALSKIYYSISGTHEQSNLLPIEGMEALFSRPWWSRTWVMQEISLCRKAGFVCGTKWLSRRKCFAAINAFTALRDVLSERAIFKQIQPTAYQATVCKALFDPRAVVMLSMRHVWRDGSFPLLALLRSTCIADTWPPAMVGRCQFEATDPRDKIYGILGLAADRDKLRSFGVEPDYTQSCAKLYTRVASAILRQGHMNLLSLCQTPKHQAGLPSWVPDWSIPLATIQATGRDHMTTIPKYRASGSLIPKVSINSTPEYQRILSVSAFVCDEIHEVGSVSWTGDLTNPSARFILAKRYLEELIYLSKLRGNPHMDVRDRLRAAARTATAEIGMSEGKG
jgi:hypothetical protein